MFQIKNLLNFTAERWKRTRQQGKKRFVLVRGILLYGGGTFFALQLGPIVVKGSLPTLEYVLPTLIISALFGLIEGHFIWEHMEQRYAKSIQPPA